MHPSVQTWVGERVAEYDLSGRSALELGSFDVNGSVRPLFSGTYIGVDLSAGPGVDRVGSSWNLPFADQAFTVVLSTEMLEHDLYPWLTLAEAYRVLAVDGHVLLTARGYDLRGCFVVHDYPGDYWRFSVSGLAALCKYVGLEVVEAIPDPSDPGVFIHARRPGGKQ